jgi:hypothetical protein
LQHDQQRDRIDQADRQECPQPEYNSDLVFVTDDWRYSSALLDKLIIVENSSILTQEQKQVYAERAIPITKK